ncbi:MAG: COR domain-containing protein [Minwuia sp.]|nr:COR domain-containing protein [Minwuia sp.]
MIDADEAMREAERRIAQWQEGQTLDLRIFALADLPASIKNLQNLQSIDCYGTQVSDLGPLQNIKSLQSINCSYTQVTDLTPLQDLQSLQSIYCYATQVSDLTPLHNLQSLQSIDCSDTQVSDLTPLQNLQSLQSIYCSRSQVSDLTPLQDLQSLQSITCSATQVSDLTPLQNLQSLQSINCPDNQVSDLTPLHNLQSLQSINCGGCNIVTVPGALWDKQTLQTVNSLGATFPDVPAEVLSKSWDDNCLGRMRAHLRDIRDGAEHLGDAKLMVLGNGRIGKTQICERLLGREFDESISSTHGITVNAMDAPGSADDSAGGRLHIWDFGGQDIYHGTHALFLRTRAVFAIVWTPRMEVEETHTHEDMVFRNYPLPYWLDYAARFGGTDSPVVVIQSQCDTPAQDALIPQDAYRRLDPFAVKSTICYSAKTDRNRATLYDALADCCNHLPNPLIGKGRLTVKNRIEALRDADMRRAPGDRQDQTITYAAFEKMCEDAGNISDTAAFLDFLHNAGTVFYRQGLFGNQLIVDQSWALDAIYAVFNRQKCVRPITSNQGRFDRSMLGGLIWDAEHTPEEQELFLSMMQSCGICFKHRSGDAARDIEAQYIAPDLLPESQPRDAGQEWEADAETQTATFSYDLLTPALMRGIIAHIGQTAGLSGEYWRSGVYVFERERRSRALIQQHMTGQWAGTITIRTQRGRARELLDALSDMVRQQEQNLGLSSERVEDGRTEPRDRPRDETSTPPALVYERERKAGQQWYVSYANSDNTPARGTPIDRFCDAACQQDRAILRDTEQLNHGDSISKFMNMLATGDRIFIFLSEAYLKSPFCMYELHQIWQRAEDDAAFMKKVRLHKGEDIPLDDSSRWFEWQDHWIDMLQRFEGRGLANLSERQTRDYHRVRKFAHDTDDILGVLADHVHSRSLEDLLANGLTDD